MKNLILGIARMSNPLEYWVRVAAWLVALPLLSALAAAADLDADPHLVGWWKFDETAGKTAADSAAKPHKAELAGGLSFDTASVPGRLGKALNCKGGFVEVTGYKGVGGTAPRTVAAWIKTTKPAGEIVCWGEKEPGRQWRFGFVRRGFGVTPDGGYLYSNERANDDAWHHVAVVVEKAEQPNLHDNVKLYLDGHLARIDDIGLLDLWPIDTGEKDDVRIGKDMDGAIDDVRIYDRPLPKEEIKALFDQASQVK